MNAQVNVEPLKGHFHLHGQRHIITTMTNTEELFSHTSAFHICSTIHFSSIF